MDQNERVEREKFAEVRRQLIELGVPCHENGCPNQVRDNPEDE